MISAMGPPPIRLAGRALPDAGPTGGFRWYRNDQRRLHTLVSHVRGPSSRRRSADTSITAAIPIVMGDNGTHD